MEETTTAITAVKEEVRLRDWAAQIEAQQASGMTVLRWCEENGIKPKTYYYHRWSLTSLGVFKSVQGCSFLYNRLSFRYNTIRYQGASR